MRSRREGRMYRLILKNKALHYVEESGRYEYVDTEYRFECESLEQLVGLLQFMVLTSDKPLDFSISKIDDETEEDE